MGCANSSEKNSESAYRRRSDASDDDHEKKPKKIKPEPIHPFRELAEANRSERRAKRADVYALLYNPKGMEDSFIPESRSAVPASGALAHSLCDPGAQSAVSDGALPSPEMGNAGMSLSVPDNIGYMTRSMSEIHMLKMHNASSVTVASKSASSTTSPRLNVNKSPTILTMPSPRRTSSKGSLLGGSRSPRGGQSPRHSPVGSPRGSPMVTSVPFPDGFTTRSPVNGTLTPKISPRGTPKPSPRHSPNSRPLTPVSPGPPNALPGGDSTPVRALSPLPDGDAHPLGKGEEGKVEDMPEFISVTHLDDDDMPMVKSPEYSPSQSSTSRSPSIQSNSLDVPQKGRTRSFATNDHLLQLAQVRGNYVTFVVTAPDDTIKAAEHSLSSAMSSQSTQQADGNQLRSSGGLHPNAPTIAGDNDEEDEPVKPWNPRTSKSPFSYRNLPLPKSRSILAVSGESDEVGRESSRSRSTSPSTNSARSNSNSIQLSKRKRSVSISADDAPPIPLFNNSSFDSAKGGVTNHSSPQPIGILHHDESDGTTDYKSYQAITFKNRMKSMSLMEAQAFMEARAERRLQARYRELLKDS